MNNRFDLHNYDDIIDLPHHTSPNRKRMSRVDRAAQFSPFAALTGYDADVIEAARTTDRKLSLSDDMKELLDRKQQLLMKIITKQSEITVTYFVPDLKKSGGSYKTFSDKLKMMDEFEHVLIFVSGVIIFIDDILDIESDVFRGVCD